MIQANELRIGNLVEKSIKSGQGRTLICKIGGEDIVRVFENIGSFNYNPIPLTEEWLLKAGFEKTYDGEFTAIFNLLIDDRISFVIKKQNAELSCIKYRNESFSHIKNAHSLQNFVYDLTGKELEFKL